MRRFVERWYGDDSVPLDVFFDPALGRFDVVAGGVVVFSDPAFVEILRWCMRGEERSHAAQTEAIEVSPWEPDE